LSGGETQRVALATALATRPEILVLDEPMTAVDPGTRRRIGAALAETIRRLGIGTLIASHDIELLQRLCPEAAFLGEGRILARGPLDEVLARTELAEIRDMAAANSVAVQHFRGCRTAPRVLFARSQRGSSSWRRGGMGVKFFPVRAI